jgi:hypothetical protein
MQWHTLSVHSEEICIPIFLKASSLFLIFPITHDMKLAGNGGYYYWGGTEFLSAYSF